MKKNSRAAYVFIAPYLILFTLFFVVTIAYAVYISLFVQKGAVSTFVGLDNYIHAFSDKNFWSGFGRTIKFAFFYVIILEIIALFLALLLDTPFVKGKSFFKLAYFLPYAVPGVIAAIMWGFLYSPKLNSALNILSVFNGGKSVELLSSENLMYAILNITIWEWAGYNVTIFLANLTSISPDLIEAAKIDGCNEFQIALRIKLPLLRSSIFMTMLLTIIGALQLFNEPYMLSFMTGIPAGYTPNMYIYRMGFSYGNFPYSAALSNILMLVTIIISVLFKKLTAGADTEQ